MWAALLVGLAGCGGDGTAAPADSAASDSAASDSAASDTVASDAVASDTVADSASEVADGADTFGGACPGFSPGPYGTHRGDLAADFTLPLADGGTFELKGAIAACDAVVVLVDTIAISPLDARSIWDDDGALADLVARSPDHAQYVFLSNGDDASAATARITPMQARVDALLAGLDASVAADWRARLHVAAARVQDGDSWLAAPLAAHLATGLAIGPDQRIHGIGFLADVERFSQARQDGGAWPWANNLAYAAYEALYLRADGERSAQLARETGVAVDLFRGEVLAELADVDVMLPSGLAAYDTLQVEVSMACPHPDELEGATDNCGAWDYIASLTMRDDSVDPPVDLEVARFITTYHREAHWIVDATALLPRLVSGGSRHFRWSFAPSWNTQPTATRLRLVFGSRARGVAPTSVVSLFSGGDFGSHYNDGRQPLTVPIPAAAKRVELWAITTGHGSGTSQCAEFCGHQHRFEVDGHIHIQTFPEAGSNDGCMAEVARGMTPNQGGTWWFGRGGWCPGAPVAPWIVDVTSEVTPGADATITYRGLLGGHDPPDGAGNIVLTSYLVIYQ
ncbi:MAG: peptide-N-glycosidase F-related protein [Myxococcota bacterium]